ERNRLVRPGREHEVRVARVEAEGDAAVRLLEHDALALDRPVAGEGPLVEAEALGERVAAGLVEGAAVPRCEALAAPVAEIGLRCAQLVPVRLRLDADAFDRDRLALDAEKLLELAL